MCVCVYVVHLAYRLVRSRRSLNLDIGNCARVLYAGLRRHFPFQPQCHRLCIKFYVAIYNYQFRIGIDPMYLPLICAIDVLVPFITENGGWWGFHARELPSSPTGY